MTYLASKSDGMASLYLHKESGLPYRYIVKFKNGASEADIAVHSAKIRQLQEISTTKLDADHSYLKALETAGEEWRDFDVSDTFKAYTCALTDDVVEEVRKDPLVEYIEQDMTIKVDDHEDIM